MVGEFGLVSGLRAVGASLLCLRGVEGGAGVALCRGENIRRSQVSARDEPRDLHLSRAVTGLSSCMHQRGDCVVPTRPRPPRSRAFSGPRAARRPHRHLPV